MSVEQGLEDFIFKTKYARWFPYLKRRENWTETVDRVKTMHLKKYAFLSEEDKKEIEWAFSLVKDKVVLPSMRAMQFGGDGIFAHNARSFNCCTRHIDSLRAIAEIGYLMLCGCGTGIGLSKKFLSRLPDLVSEKSDSVITYVIDDTIEGWADSLEALLMSYFKNTIFSGRHIVFDYSKIRRKGSPLKTGGGKAPGARPLRIAHNKIRKLLDSLIDNKVQQARPIHIYDVLMYFADAVLSGGVRRTASSVVFDKDDQEMIKAKSTIIVDKYKIIYDEEEGTAHIKVWINGLVKECILDKVKNAWDIEELQKNKQINWFYVEAQRARSNNSILLLRNKTTFEEFKAIFEYTKQYGEPGFVFANNEDTIFNPCIPTYGIVLTKTGMKKVEDVKIGEEIWSKEGWTKVINKSSSGIKPVYRYRTTHGYVDCTDNHKLISQNEKIEAKDCESIDILRGINPNSLILDPQDIMDGLVIGDGTKHKASNDLVHLEIGKDDEDYFNSEITDLILAYRPGLNEYAYLIKTTIQSNELDYTYNRIIPDRFIYGSPSKVCGFLRGLYSANGSICGGRVTLKTASFKLRDQVQKMLSSIGIKSYFTTNKPTMVKFSNGDYLCKESYDINISTDSNKFVKLIGYIQKYKTEKINAVLDKKKYTIEKLSSADITTIEELGDQEVFDITVDNNSHTFWYEGFNIANCFEIGFIPVLGCDCGVQFCNLTTINATKIKSTHDFKEATIASAIIGTLQAGYTDFPYLNKTAKLLTEDEALLGCSITGIFENPELFLDDKHLQDMMQEAVSTNEEWAAKLGINPASRVGAIKPEGTGSLTIGVQGPGAHAVHSEKFFRRVQIDKDDNIYQFFKMYNPDFCEESIWNSNKTDDVIAFPVQSKPGSIYKKDISAIDHLEIIKKLQKNWVIPGQKNNKKDVNNSVSCTVLVKNDEWDKVIEYMYSNKEYFSAVSFLPDNGDKLYKQAPFETITNGQTQYFEDMRKKFINPNYDELIENYDETSHSSESSCSGGACLT